MGEDQTKLLFREERKVPAECDFGEKATMVIRLNGNTEFAYGVSIIEPRIVCTIKIEHASRRDRERAGGDRLLQNNFAAVHFHRFSKTVIFQHINQKCMLWVGGYVCEIIAIALNEPEDLLEQQFSKLFRLETRLEL
jgi:hypothetical protein